MRRYFPFITICAVVLSISTQQNAAAQMLTGQRVNFPKIAPYQTRQDATPNINRRESASVEIFSLDGLGTVTRIDEQPLTNYETLNNTVVQVSELPEIQTMQTEQVPENNDSPSTTNNLNEQNQPVDFQADNLQYDEQNQIVTATGNVVLTQNGRTLTADKVVYNVNQDKATAIGNVVLNDTSGDIYTGDQAVLEKEFKNGFIEGFKGELTDDSRFWASKAERIDGNKIVLDDARYTACKICQDNPDDDPLWQIKADKVTHDKEARRITYKNARFEVAGVPVLYSPYLAHSDGTIERKSGFLSPSAGFQSQTGFFVQSDYYYDIAPDKDATIGLRVMTDELPLAMGEYRQRWNNASLIASGGVTYSSFTDNVAGQSIAREEELRGHMFAEGIWDMNDKWRSGLKINYSSDDQYLRQYNLPAGNNILENEVYAERFFGRNYAVGRLLSFQDIRVGLNRSDDQPQILPEIQASFTGDANSVPLVGGTWNANFSALGLRREGSDQDLTRASLDLGWKKRMVAGWGLVFEAEAHMRGDAYSIRDADGSVGSIPQGNNETDARFFPAVQLTSSYPIAKSLTNSQIIIEPKAAVTLTPHFDQNDDLPNEDSLDVQIDSANIFKLNRFPGFDRVEDRSRVTYGLNAGVYGNDSGHFSGFLGQSYRFEDESALFPQGSGLNGQASDIVGQVSASIVPHTLLNYNVQLDDETFASRRHEIYGNTQLGPLKLNGSYLYAAALAGTDITESREQARMGGSYAVTPEWSFLANATQDLGEDEGLRQANMGLSYIGQCVSASLIGQKNFTSESSGDSGTELFLRVGLKNLGEFGTQ